MEGDIPVGRDSIFQHSRNANQQNRLQDWSFMDEKMLLSAAMKTGITGSISEEVLVETGKRKKSNKKGPHLGNKGNKKDSGSPRSNTKEADRVSLSSASYK